MDSKWSDGLDTRMSVSDNVPPLPYERQKTIVRKISQDLRRSLDIGAIYGSMIDHNLLTEDEKEQFQDPPFSSLTRNQKISRLILALPRKGEDALCRFVMCLKSSTEGTAHGELVHRIIGLVKIADEEDELSRRQLFILYLVVPTCLFLVLLVCYPTMFYTQKQASHNLPFFSHFVGRSKELHHILHLLDYSSSQTGIVNIYGPPGFGKSTLAIQIGFLVCDTGVDVNYINLDECPKEGIIPFLIEKLSTSFGTSEIAATFDELLQLARDNKAYHLVILDNCDDVLHTQQNDLQSIVQKVVENSLHVKFVLTSREITSYPDRFEEYKITELTTEAACELLQYHLPNNTNLTQSELEKLAKITGNVPLALKIVSSLFRLSKFVSSAAIIEELQSQPIAQLSPKQLPVSSQINASFTLSYRYLSDEEKQISRFLSYFPGSFSKEASISMLLNVSFLHRPMGRSIAHALKELVQRSLLEQDSSNNSRFYFHCLIKEYFIEIERSLGSPLHAEFTATFQAHFLTLLSNISKAFHSQSYAKSLAILDKERHNFVKVSDDFEKNQDIKCDLLLAISSLADALQGKLLLSRFTSRQILPLLRASVSFFDGITNEALVKSSAWKEAYLYLLDHLIYLEEKNNSTENAMEVFEKYSSSGIEKFGVSIADKTYIRILVKVTGLCLKLKHSEELLAIGSPCKQYFSKALMGCDDIGDCPYREFGIQLKAAKQYDQAARFLEASLLNENHTNLTRLLTLLDLSKIYTNFYRMREAYNALEEIEQMLPVVTNLPKYELFQNIEDLNRIIKHLRDLQNYEAADVLEDRAIDAILTGNESGNVSESFHLVKKLYDKGNYAEAIQLGSQALQSSESVRKSDEYSKLFVRLLVLISKAKIRQGNYSEGYADMEAIFNATVKLDLYREYWMCCFYMIPRLTHIHTCFIEHITDTVDAAVQLIMNNIFSLPFPSEGQGVNDSNQNLIITLPGVYKKAQKLQNANYLVMTQWLFVRLFLLVFWLPMEYSSARFIFNFAFILARIDLAIILIEAVAAFIVILILCIIYDNDTLQPRKFFRSLRLLFTRIYSYLLLTEKAHSIAEILLYFIEFASKIEKLIDSFIMSHFLIHYFIYQNSKKWNMRWLLLLFTYFVLTLVILLPVAHFWFSLLG